MMWVKLTFPAEPVRTSWLLSMRRLTSRMRAGITLKLVAVGTPRLAVMLATIRPAAPRSGVTVSRRRSCGLGVRERWRRPDECQPFGLAVAPAGVAWPEVSREGAARLASSTGSPTPAPPAPPLASGRPRRPGRRVGHRSDGRDRRRAASSLPVDLIAAIVAP